MQLRTYHKLAILTGGMLLTAMAILCLCQRGNAKVRTHAALCDSLSDIESNLNLQGRYIDALIHARLSGGSTEEATAQANEAGLTITNAVSRLMNDAVSLKMPLDFAAIKESWEALQELRTEVIAGREVAKNRDLANTAAISLSQL
ncbi:MAG: hypothetical protein IJJ33_07565, partial [Victivallales bacterium]|nr:hypothetical protein [Victivallales bacterium]